MGKTHRTVVGVDGSEGGRFALEWAVSEAAERGGTVEAVTAWHWDGVRRAPLVDATPADAKQRAQQILDRELAAVNIAASSTPVTGTLAAGEPATALTQAARHANLLVLGSHGHGHLRHAVLGSVSEKCVQHAPCPVVVIPVPVGHSAVRPPATVG